VHRPGSGGPRAFPSSGGRPGRVRIGDIVFVPPLRPVVRLADRHDAQLRQELVDTFVPTEEAQRVLQAVARRLAARKGGVLVMGGYGSGKSHLLSLLAEMGERHPLPKGQPYWPVEEGPPPLVVAISLVEHSSREPLEDILLGALLPHLEACPTGESRRERWKQVALALRAQGYPALLVLLDELSAFLRAKPRLADLREDVRLLQYLAEAQDLPLVLVATLQETLETAGQVDPDTARRLRDRYVTLPLTGAHLEEVVCRRLLQPREGHQEAVAAVRQRLSRSLGPLPWDAERFDRLYPVYPATLEHLDALRHYLSSARGALDFVYRHLVGDPERGLPALLDQEVGALLTPDALFPHFALRLAEVPEVAPWVQRVEAFFQQEGARLLGEDAPLAQRVVRLLCVQALGARPRPLSPKEVAVQLGLGEFALDPGVAPLAVGRLLERMVAEGAYVVRETGEDGMPRYRVDPGAHLGLTVERRVKELTERLRLLAADSAEAARAEALSLARLLSQVGDDPALPLATLSSQRETTRGITWQRTARSGVVVCGDLFPAGPVDIQAMADELAQPGRDFVLLVPLAATKAGVAAARDYVETVLRPTLAGRAEAAVFLAWLPRPLQEPQLLERGLALLELAQEYATAAGGPGGEALRLVKARLEELASRLREGLTDAYYKGEVLLGTGETLGSPQGLRPLGFRETLQRLAGAALEVRHPGHGSVLPRVDPGEISQQVVEGLLDTFFSQGELAQRPTPEEAALLEGVVVPLGLGERHGQGYRLRLDPARSPALSALLGELAAAPQGEVAREELVRALCKGPLGLDLLSAKLTLWAALFGGLAEGVQGGRRVPLARLKDASALDRLQALRQAEGGDLAVPPALARLPFLEAASQGPYLPARQREMWARAVKWKAETQARAVSPEDLTEATADPTFARWQLDGAREDLRRLGRLLAAVSPSLGPGQGLGRLAQVSQEEGEADLAQALERALAWCTFVRDEAPELLRAQRYLSHPALVALEESAPDLSGMRRGLLEDLTRAPGLLTSQARADWRGRWEAFRAAYRQRYAHAHGQAVGTHPGPALGSLARRFPRAASSPEGQARQQAILARHCPRTPGRVLDVDPLCPCGYRLGDPPLTADLSRFAQWLEEHEGDGPPPVPATLAPPARSLKDLLQELGPPRQVDAGELRRRFEAWLRGQGEEAPPFVELRP
jgi:hypothetical protein